MAGTFDIPDLLTQECGAAGVDTYVDLMGVAYQEGGAQLAVTVSIDEVASTNASIDRDAELFSAVEAGGSKDKWNDASHFKIKQPSGCFKFVMHDPR